MNTDFLQQIGILGANGHWLIIVAVLFILFVIVELARLILWLFSKNDKLPYQRECSRPTHVEEQKQANWTCPRCNQEIDIDPYDSDSDSCPLCKQSLQLMTCTQCGKDIWADSSICPEPECQAQLPMSKCPSCGKHLFISKFQESCPYCGCEETLWICPRCQQYINEDPEDLDECPNCHQPLIRYSCSKCDQGGIFIDLQVCPCCKENLQFEACPECGQSIPSGLDDCPCCEEGLTVTECPHCQKEHYVKD